MAVTKAANKALLVGNGETYVPTSQPQIAGLGIGDDLPADLLELFDGRITVYNTGDDEGADLWLKGTGDVNAASIALDNMVSGCKWAPAIRTIDDDAFYLSSYDGSQWHYPLNIDQLGNIGLGTTTWPTANAEGVLFFKDNAATPTMGAATAGIFAKAVDDIVQMFAIGSDGNATQISPHDPETGEFVFTSENPYTGRRTRIFLERMARVLQKLTDEVLITEEELPEDERLDWKTVQATHMARQERRIARWEALAEPGDVSKPEPFVESPPPPFITPRQRKGD